MKLTEEELLFIEEEFGISKDDLEAEGDELLLEIGDRCFDIELEGDISDSKQVSDRCGMASAIYQKISEM